MTFTKKMQAFFCFLAVSQLLGCTSATNENRNISLAGTDSSNVTRGDPAMQLNSTSTLHDNYFIAPGDLVEIKFPNNPTFNDEFIVAPDGKISLTFIDPVVAAGKTPSQLQGEIQDLYTILQEDGTGNGATEKEYRIQVNDQLDIRFPYQSEFNELVVVRPDGKISLPLIGSIIAENKTPEQLTSELTSAYQVPLLEPELVVIVKEFSSSRYFVDGVERDARIKDMDDSVVILRRSTPMQIFVGGEVRTPGFFPYSGPVTAIQAIIMAGGNLLTGEMGQVAVIRNGPGQEPTLFLRNLNYGVSEGDDGRMPIEYAALGDVILQPSDVVIVPKTTIGTVTDYLDQYLFNLIPALRNSSFGFVYNLNPYEGADINLPVNP